MDRTTAMLMKFAADRTTSIAAVGFEGAVELRGSIGVPVPQTASRPVAARGSRRPVMHVTYTDGRMSSPMRCVTFQSHDIGDRQSQW